VAIYLDHAATTPMLPEAQVALNSQIANFGNASSLHTYGRAVRRRVEEAREEIAALVGADPTEIIFTGSGTEANNLAVKGFYWSAVERDPSQNLIVVAAFEHHAILEPIEWLAEHEAADIRYIPILSTGLIDLDALAEIIERERDRIALITVMHSNNEVGTISPIATVVALAGDIPVHTDAVQSFGKVDFNFGELGVTSATISSHKIGGPLGVAALVLRHGIDLTPILHGGGQERDIRSGTINAPSIAAFAAAAKESCRTLADNFLRISDLRESLKSVIEKQVPDATFNGYADDTQIAKRLPGILNVTFPGTESDSLLLLLDNAGIAASTGSACSAGVQRASHVLISMGLSEEEAASSMRFSLGRTSTDADIRRVGEVIAEIVRSARAAYSIGNGAAR
jgi:cysteine desulfurase